MANLKSESIEHQNWFLSATRSLIDQLERDPVGISSAVQALARAAHDLVAVLQVSASMAELGKAPESSHRKAPASRQSRATSKAAGAALKPIAKTSSAKDLRTGFVRNGQKTVFDDHIVCLLDGSNHVFLRRHLRKKGIPEQDYLSEFDLPKDYPLTAPSYVIRQREAAKRTKFGTAIRPKREQK